MTVKELIEKLKEYPENTPVFVNTNGYGDFEELENELVYYDEYIVSLG